MSGVLVDEQQVTLGVVAHDAADELGVHLTDDRHAVGQQLLGERAATLDHLERQTDPFAHIHRLTATHLHTKQENCQKKSDYSIDL